ncbi:ceramide synthase 2 [Polyodon spathula]|uniref:ceramide synthase 2 n=1 Tax=Polyodon spathula TaxID=7913 RepID=UPI001B7EBC3E|nr:ceramide synthase 2 [Polyodon spathula]XP_041075336.1 ceramide synthase 2 [Polyodon spathula]
MLQTISDYFWWDRLWFPGNLTWTDFEDKDGLVFAKVSHLFITVPYAVAFMVIRYIFERFIATHIAKEIFGLRDTVRLKASENIVLEKYFVTSLKNPSQSDLEGLAKKCNWTVRKVERWFRRRRNQERPSVLKKFEEACWRFVFYLSAFIGGFAALYDKPWFTDTLEIFNGFPKQTLLDSQYWYYIIEMSFYCSLLFSVAFDVKRKDFKEQIIHHLATLNLLAFSWCCNYIRVGTLVMLIHDTSDVLLESAKMFNYAGFTTICNSLFVLFSIVFIITRLVIFPFWIIHCTWFYPVLFFPPFFGYYFFNAMLIVLQMLHIFWTCLILRMVKKFIFGNMVGDERSDHEEEEDEETSQEEGDQRMRNGSATGRHPGPKSQCDH